MEETTNPNPKNSRKKHLIRNLFIGALFAISVLLITLPSLMSNPNKPGGSYMYVGYLRSMNRAQKAYYLDYGKFASSLEELNLPASVAPKTRSSLLLMLRSVVIKPQKFLIDGEP